MVRFYSRLPRIYPSCLCAWGKGISLSPRAFPILSGTPRIRVITQPCGTNFISCICESVVGLALLDYSVRVKQVPHLPNLGTYLLQWINNGAGELHFVVLLLTRKSAGSVQNNLKFINWDIYKLAPIIDSHNRNSECQTRILWHFYSVLLAKNEAMLPHI